MKHGLGLLIGCLVLLFSLAAEAAPAPEVTVESQSGRVKTLEARVVIDAPVGDVWKTLTDYNGLKRFMPGYQVSQVLQTNGAQKKVLFAQKVVPVLPAYQYQVAVNEDREHYTIHLERLSGDFAAFEGTYRLTPQGARTVLTYQLLIDLGPGTPTFGANKILQSGAEKTFAAIQTQCVKTHRKSVLAQR